MGQADGASNGGERWPALPLDHWRATRDALHAWTQVIGKSLLACCAPQNHWWHTAMRVSARGLASPSPLRCGDVSLDVELDLVDHAVVVRSSGGTSSLALGPMSVHDFYDRYVSLLRHSGVDVRLWTTPVEIPSPVPFDEDDTIRPYDRDAAHRLWIVLRRMDALLRQLSTGYVGKQSPVHFFWGSFDLAATRFSGRRAPERPDADRVTREAYSHEVVSFGFWPGGVTATGVSVEEPILYAYAAPEPPGFRDADVTPVWARYDKALGEFVLPYDAVRRAPDPERTAVAFWTDVYEAAAVAGAWDRASLERRDGADGARAPAHDEASSDGAPMSS